MLQCKLEMTLCLLLKASLVMLDETVDSQHKIGEHPNGCTCPPALPPVCEGKSVAEAIAGGGDNADELISSV